MIKKMLFIAVLVALLGYSALAEPEANADQKKAPAEGVAKHMQRIDQWSSELKAAYEAKDMDKIGELIEQMDNFKTKFRKERAEKRVEDSEKSWKGERGQEEKGFYEGQRQNKNRMQRPMNRQQDGEQGWARYQQRQGGDRQFAQGPRRGMRAGMRHWKNCPWCCGDMNRAFPGRWQGMRNQWNRWRGQYGCYQGQGFDGDMRPRQMRKHWQGQDNPQCPMAMQRNGNFRHNRQMAGGFDDHQQEQCPMYQQQRDFEGQRKSWGDCKFRGPQKQDQGRNRQRQEMSPSENEWEW